MAIVANVRAERPNVVFILADDLGWGDLQCYNALSKIPTPQCDLLAGEGIRFTDAHAPAAVCTPTRYGILTGRYCWRTTLKSGVLQGYDPLLIEPQRLTVASFLKQHGYAT
ncbi:MAG TPA: sulfatase-like hydrolase/transferase, partial [Pirellulales bacterium]|nr:sulfatase-like hydrolase/transferase [Pirellulales bacterium]